MSINPVLISRGANGPSKILDLAHMLLHCLPTKGWATEKLGCTWAWLRPDRLVHWQHCLYLEDRLWKYDITKNIL